MSKNIKILIAIGGTGGHVFPGCNLAYHLAEQNYNIKLVTDSRGYKFCKNFKDLNITVLPSSPLMTKNIFKLFYSSIFIIFSILYALLFLIFNRPSIIFGMGGYASFPICIAASILNIKFIIYENNLLLGKSNKYLLPFAKKILISNKELDGVPKKYMSKTYLVGNIIKKDIINFGKKNSGNIIKGKLRILVLGGSQAAKIFAETLPGIFHNCSKNGINLKIYQHCLPSQNEKLKIFYEKNNIEFEIFNFCNNLIEYFKKINFAITRSGSSILAELTNANIPFINIPLPSSADNHQLKNANFYKERNLAFIVEEKNLNDKLALLIKDIFNDNSKLVKILQNQRQYSDKNVYNNVDQLLKDLINEKN